jgi:hypothetical protein
MLEQHFLLTSIHIKIAEIFCTILLHLFSKKSRLFMLDILKFAF